MRPTLNVIPRPGFDLPSRFGRRFEPVQIALTGETRRHCSGTALRRALEASGPAALTLRSSGDLSGHASNEARRRRGLRPRRSYSDSTISARSGD